MAYRAHIGDLYYVSVTTGPSAIAELLVNLGVPSISQDRVKFCIQVGYIKSYQKNQQEGLAVARIARDDGSSSTNRSSYGYD